MKRIGKMLAVILGAGLLVFVGAMIGPRSAHALVATLVQLNNSLANPVPSKDVDNPAEQPFQAFSTFEPIGTFANFYTVPTGKRAVVETLEVIGSPVTTRVFFTINGAGGSLDYTTHDQATPTLFYADPGTVLSFQSLGGVGGSQVVVIGHLVTLE
jgi:hypothetical protein